MLEFTVVNVMKIIIGYVMCFSFGMKFKVSDKVRKVASYVWGISIAILWILALTN